MLRHCKLLAPALLAVSGCALPPETPPGDGVALPYVTSFAAGRSGSVDGSGWQEWSLSSFKKPTRYELIEDSGTHIIKTSADGSASDLRHALKIDPAAYPVLT